MIEKVQLKYDGHFHEVAVGDLDMDPESASDSQVRQAVERHLSIDSLSEYVVEPGEGHADRGAATILNLRPEASFGR